MALALPKDGMIVRDADKTWVFYQVGSWWMMFDLGTPEEAQQYDTEGMATGERYFNGGDITTFPAVVKADSPAMLSAIAGGFGTMAEFWQSSLKVLGNPDARGDAEIQRIIVMQMLRPTMSETEFRSRLADTAWYKSRTETQRAWNDLGEADQRSLVEQTKAKLRESYLETFGVYPDDSAINQWAVDVASGVLGYGSVVDAMRRQAAGNPESPWSRTLRSEQENQRLRTQQVSDMTGALRSTAERWGVQLTPDALKQWASDIVTRTKSEVDFEELMKDQALALYPNKPRELDTASYAQSWMSSYMRVLERSDATLFNPVIQSALQRGVNLADFERELRDDPAWMQTKNAMETMTANAARIGARMGFL